MSHNLWPFENMRGLKKRFRENQKQEWFLTEVFMDGTYSNIYPICQNNFARTSGQEYDKKDYYDPCLLFQVVLEETYDTFTQLYGGTKWQIDR